MIEIKQITTNELQEKLERKDNFKLVMTFGKKGFKAMHIPGSLNIYSQESAEGLINPNDEIIVYCVNNRCQASINAYKAMYNLGFKNLRRYAGGLEEWNAAGYKLEGTSIDKLIDTDDDFMK